MKASSTGAVKVGIIGLGRFGKLAARIIRANFKDVQVLVFARRQGPGASRNIKFASFEEVCGSDVVIPCVPISAFADVIKSMAPVLRPGALVLDVCSVKVYPVEVMEKHLPAGVEILATHPIFGPDSARRGLAGLKIVMHNVRVPPEKFRRIKQSCREIGLEVVEMTPDEHDRLVAFSQAYAHLVGRIGEKMNLKKTIIDTRGFARLMEVQDQISGNSLELFKDMQRFNPYAGEMRRQFRRALDELEAELSR